MSRPSRVVPAWVTVTLPAESDRHPVPDVTSPGTRRSAVPEGTPVVAEVGKALPLGAVEDGAGGGVGVGVVAGLVGVGDVVDGVGFFQVR
jgi:hypothetical protein